MKYEKTLSAKFISRPNRFIAEVEVNSRCETVHVKNTGRCRELLVPGAKVILSDSQNPLRKTRYDLVAVYKERPGKPPLLINMDSQLPNSAAAEWLASCGMFSENAVIRREFTWKNSRFDFYIEDGQRKAFLEVKGVTLETDGSAAFPDAPTERGVKHIKELKNALGHGFEAYILFVIQMKEVSRFHPNDATHPAFGEALREAAEAGVRLMAMDCAVTESGMTIDAPVPIDLSR